MPEDFAYFSLNGWVDLLRIENLGGSNLKSGKEVTASWFSLKRLS